MRIPTTVPELKKVKDSSNILAIGYSPKTKYLYVQFHPSEKTKHGDVYRYVNVPEPLFKRFQKAPSKGIFFHGNIKGKFSYAKWTGFGWRKEASLKRLVSQKKKRKQTFKKWNT